MAKNNRTTTKSKADGAIIACVSHIWTTCSRGSSWHVFICRAAMIFIQQLKEARWHPEPSQRSASVAQCWDTHETCGHHVCAAVSLQSFYRATLNIIHCLFSIFYKEGAYSINFRINSFTLVPLINSLCYSITLGQKGQGCLIVLSCFPLKVGVAWHKAKLTQGGGQHYKTAQVNRKVSGKEEKTVKGEIQFVPENVFWWK